jgi:hypothetical protein
MVIDALRMACAGELTYSRFELNRRAGEPVARGETIYSPIA